MNRTDRAIARFTMLGNAPFSVYELTIPLFVVIWLDAFDVSAAVLGTVVAVGYALIGVGALERGSRRPDRFETPRRRLDGGNGRRVRARPLGAAASLSHSAGLSLITPGSHSQ